MMKRLLLACVLGLTFLLTVQAVGAETIKMGYWIHKPHHYLPDPAGKPRGAGITYFEMMAAKMGYTVEWEGPLPFLRILDYLKDGTIDGCAHLLKLPVIEGFVDYGDQPYHNAQAIFVARQENPVAQITAIKDVAGYRVGFIVGIDPSLFVRDNLTQLKLDNVPPGDAMWEQSLTKLLADRIDVVHDMNAYTLPFIAKQMKIDSQVKTLLLPEPPQPVYVGFSRQSAKGKALIEKYNAVQKDMPPFGQADYEKLIQQESDAVAK